jgi:sugar/nucleoside kinase (ribokinase family)
VSDPDRTILVVGSVALDSVATPFGTADDVVGGSAVFFASAASAFTSVRLVGVVGADYPVDRLDSLGKRGVDLSGLERASGPSFRWRGRYGHDLNVAETLDTQLGAFAEFRPKIPAAFRTTPYVFLANIDPRLQLEVLDQMQSPRLVACDTMNFWITSQRPALLQLLGRVDLVMINDGEARQLSERVNLVHAARWILEHGPRHVIIKKGEHGAFLFTQRAKDSGAGIFFAPAYPLEKIFDPTGAGDSFAGGFMGHIASTGDLSEPNLRRAVIVGSAMGSFAVEKFSNTRLLEITAADVAARIRAFRELVAWEEAG